MPLIRSLQPRRSCRDPVNAQAAVYRALTRTVTLFSAARRYGVEPRLNGICSRRSSRRDAVANSYGRRHTEAHRRGSPPRTANMTVLVTAQ